VFQPFEMRLRHRESNTSSSVRGVNLLVFSSWGWLTHIVPFRNGAAQEAADRFIGTALLPQQQL
jgi:hypothetical protein